MHKNLDEISDLFINNLVICRPIDRRANASPVFRQMVPGKRII